MKVKTNIENFVVNTMNGDFSLSYNRSLKNILTLSMATGSSLKNPQVSTMAIGLTVGASVAEDLV